MEGHWTPVYPVHFLGGHLSTIMIRVLGILTPLTKDPIVCGIFGAVVNGLGTGFALRNNISTGGIDIRHCIA